RAGNGRARHLRSRRQFERPAPAACRERRCNRGQKQDRCNLRDANVQGGCSTRRATINEGRYGREGITVARDCFPASNSGKLAATEMASFNPQPAKPAIWFLPWRSAPKINAEA